MTNHTVKKVILSPYAPHATLKSIGIGNIGKSSLQIWYYTQSNMAAFVPEIKARFQVDVLTTYEPRPNIPYVKAYLVAMKGNDLPGICGWPR